MSPLERSNAELRVIVNYTASKEIVNLNFGKRNTPLLWNMREVPPVSRITSVELTSVRIKHDGKNNGGMTRQYLPERLPVSQKPLGCKD